MIYTLFACTLVPLFYFCQYVERISESTALYSSIPIGDLLAKTFHKLFFNTMLANHNNQLFSMMGNYSNAGITGIKPRFCMEFRFFKSIDEIQSQFERI